jgi:Domain of unknown function (DUF4262)
METALDFPHDTLDEHERRFVSNVREHGFFTTGVRAAGELPGFSYTTGFWLSLQAPEVVTFSTKAAHDLAWNLFRDAKSGVVLPVGRATMDVLENFPVYFFSVAERHYSVDLGWSRWFYNGATFPCLQLVWPDREGTFPWQKGFDEAFRKDQIDLTENGWLASLRI